MLLVFGGHRNYRQEQYFQSNRQLASIQRSHKQNPPHQLMVAQQHAYMKIKMPGLEGAMTIEIFPEQARCNRPNYGPRESSNYEL